MLRDYYLWLFNPVYAPIRPTLVACLRVSKSYMLPLGSPWMFGDYFKKSSGAGEPDSCPFITAE